MCGRYQLLEDQDIDEINKIIAEVQSKVSSSNEDAYLSKNENVNLSKSVKFGEIFPTNRAPILVGTNIKNDRAARVEVMHWGFQMGKSLIINARSETANDKRMFKQPLSNNRCVIPSTGFFEWTKSGKPKEKFLFNQPGRRMLYMAGVSAKYRVKGGDIPEDCYVILTRDANRYMADVHNRMPVILDEEEINLWLTDINFVQFALNRDTIVLERKPAG